MNSTSVSFKSIVIDDLNPDRVQFQNPFPDRYSRISTRREMIKAWNDECAIREKELEAYRATFNKDE